MVICYTQLANIIIFVIDLAQGIITTIHFDEEQHELWTLFLFWFFWTLAYALFASVCLKSGERKCYWDDCLVLCGFAVGQCCLFIDFCRDEAHMTWPLILLASNQIMLKIFWTLTHCCQGWQEEHTPGAAHRVVPTAHNQPRGQLNVHEDGIDQVYAYLGFSPEKGGIRQTIFGKAFSEAFPALWACFLCLCQRESPFRAKEYEVLLCAFVWIQSFMRKLKRAQRKNSWASGFDYLLVYLQILFVSGFSIVTSIFYWSWGLSPDLSKTYDRVITVLGMIMTCLGLFYTLYILCCFAVCGRRKK